MIRSFSVMIWRSAAKVGCSQCLAFLFETHKASSSPYINRFLSADSIVPNPANPQSLNRYSYVVNNPLRYIDPTGHMFTDDQCGYQGQDCGGYLGGTGGGGGSSNNNNDDDEDENEPGGSGSQPQPSPTPIPEDCPDWSVCMNDGSPGAMQDYWESNDTFTDIMEILGLVGAGGGPLISAFGAWVSQYVTWNTVALVTGVALLEPSLIGEALIVGGFVVAAVGFTVSIYAYDVGNINDAIVTTGAYPGGGSIVANADGAIVTGVNGTTETVDTILPISAPLNLLLWGVTTPGITAVQQP